MGGIKRPKKKYHTPGHPYQKERIMEELKLVGKFGLRNKREVWKAKTFLSNIRRRARNLLALSAEDPQRMKLQTELLNKLIRFGMISKSAGVAEILGLQIEEILRRRLQSLVFDKGLARTPHQSRQLIIHGHIAIAGQKNNAPSYLVPADEETKIGFYQNSPLSSPDHIINQFNRENE